MRFEIRRATRQQSRLRLGLVGPAGSGKTYTALQVARYMGGRIVVLDTEHGSASLYADLTPFDVVELDSFAPATYVAAIQFVEAQGYDFVIIDSLSHAWMGKDGALEMVDRAAKRSQSGNSFTAWRDVTPEHNRMIDTILACRAHVIATLRSKTAYVQERDEKTGKTTVRKIGLEPIQRDGLDYEFGVTGTLDYDHTLCITKSRCSTLADAVIPNPGEQLAVALRDWLGQGVAPAPEPEPAPPPLVQPAQSREPAARDLEPAGVGAPGTPAPSFEQCRSCHAPIVWEKTKNGKAMPYDVIDGKATDQTHFITCPQSRAWSNGERPIDPPVLTDAPGPTRSAAEDLAGFEAAVKAATTVRFPFTGKGLQDMLAAARGDLKSGGLECSQADVERALGGSVSAYATVRGWKGEVDCLDRVWAVLEAKVRRDEPVPGRLSAVE